MTKLSFQGPTITSTQHISLATFVVHPLNYKCSPVVITGSWRFLGILSSLSYSLLIFFCYCGFRSVTTALSFFWGSSVRQGDSKIQYWKKYSDAFCFPPNRITQVMLNSSFLNSSFLKWLPTASFLFPHHSQTKTCIKLKLTESQGPHCFGKVLFVTFVPANRENAGDIHFWPS